MRPLEGRERAARWIAATVFVATAVALTSVESVRTPSILTVAILVCLYAAASRMELEVASGSAVPTQLVFVPMLFVLPAPLIPLAVASALVLGDVPACVRGRLHPERLAGVVASSWFAVPPALVMLAAGEPSAELSAWPILGLALIAQAAGDFVSTTLSEKFAFDLSPRELLAPMAWVFAFDGLLAVGGFAIAVSTRDAPEAVAGFVVPMLVLVMVFARERQGRIDNALELSSTYRGTAFLLGDVVESDDKYTGDHSKDVVDLVLAVCEELGVERRVTRRAEFAALLHDVGKLRVPSEIINKPGPLTDEERAIINTHTIEGEALLERVGGLLGEVGRIVRSCHEHFDGSGYPDGLKGDAIPLEARIICCCDAYNAMITDRPYRQALSLEQPSRN